MMAEPSGMQPEDWDKLTYPDPKPAYARQPGEEPAIDLGNGHKLHAREYGNPDGEPVIVLHGGPGGGCESVYSRFFDPKRYRIILFDQRGCGNSTPRTFDDLEGGMKGNNTAELVEDINAVRKHFNISGKMHVEGGSWGSTLALAYAIKHPQNVESLQMRGIFLGTPEGGRFIFQGNAADYQEAEKPLSKNSTPEEEKAFLDHFYSQDYTKYEGTYRAYAGDGSVEGQIPAKLRAGTDHMKFAAAVAWDEFVRIIPKAEREDMITAYDKRFHAIADESLRGSETFDPASNRIDPDYQRRLAYAFAKWEGLMSRFSQTVEADGKINLGKFEDPDFALDFARIEAHYTRNGFFLSEDGSPSPGGSTYLMDNLHRIAEHNIPMYFAHGANDQICPVRDAYTLEKAYKAALEKAVPNPNERAAVVLISNEATGHSMVEKGNVTALMQLINPHDPVKTNPYGWVDGSAQETVSDDPFSWEVTGEKLHLGHAAESPAAKRSQ